MITPPDGWTIPESYTFESLGTCRGCRQRIAWTETPAGKQAPLDPDGTNHFVTCPERERFRRPK